MLPGNEIEKGGALASERINLDAILPLARDYLASHQRDVQRIEECVQKLRSELDR